MSRIIMSIEEEFSGKVIGSFDLTEYADRVYNQALEDSKKELIKIYNKRYMHDIYLDDLDDIIKRLSR